MRWLIRTTAWERTSRPRRILLAFVRVALLIALVEVLIDVLGPPISIFWTVRSVAREFPGVRVVPQPLTDQSVSSGPAVSLSYFGYEFDVPWNIAFKVKGGKASIVHLQFDSGQTLTFIVPRNQSGLLSEFTQDRSMNLANLQPVFGELVNESAYDQQAAMLSTTPESVRAFGPRAQTAGRLTLLLFKATATGPSLPTGVFSFQFQDKRGFQIGDPQKSDRIDLEVFGMGGHHVEIVLLAGKDSAKLSQPEVNRILTSLRPAKANTPVSD